MSLNFFPRRLVALNINDEAGQIRLGQDQQFITFEEIDSYIAAQELLLSASETKDTCRADLFLIDVNFGRSEIEPQLEWSAPDDLRPFGPLLALPFLGRELAAFVPYSNYWGDDTLQRNGYVLITISLLLAVTKKEVQRLGKVRQLIKNAKSNKGLHSTATSALNEALKQYRASLRSLPNIQLVDVKRTIRRLESLEENMDDFASGLPIPLQDAEGVLSLDFAYPPYHLDSIELSSLFADCLKFNLPSQKGDFNEIFNTLEEWGETSVELGGNTLQDAAKAALARVEESRDDDNNLLTIKEAVDLEIKHPKDKYLVRRLAMEFAWVQAWYEDLMYSAPVAATRRNQLNDPHEPEVSDSESEFEERFDRERPTRISMVHNALGIDKLRYPATEYPRLLSNGGNVSTEKWRTEFKDEYSGVNDAYQLDENEPSSLTPLEKAMCKQYAQDVLDWDGSNRFVRGVFNPSYPRWMI